MGIGAGKQEKLRQRLEEKLLVFRVAQKGAGTTEGWLRPIQQAQGIPVDELARRMGVCRWEVFRLEKAEIESRIMLGTLRRAAAGLGCELIYALAPVKGTLEELAAEHSAAHEKTLKAKRAARQAQLKLWLEKIGWREKFRNVLRTLLRRDGIRVRPRKTTRGDKRRMEDMRVAMKLVEAGRGIGTRDQGVRD